MIIFCVKRVKRPQITVRQSSFPLGNPPIQKPYQFRNVFSGFEKTMTTTQSPKPNLRQKEARPTVYFAALSDTHLEFCRKIPHDMLYRASIIPDLSKTNASGLKSIIPCKNEERSEDPEKKESDETEVIKNGTGKEEEDQKNQKDQKDQKDKKEQQEQQEQKKEGDEKKKILILAGDVGNPFKSLYKQFLVDASQLFSHVLLVRGNHECYQPAAKVWVGQGVVEGGESTDVYKGALKNEPARTIAEVDARIEEIVSELPNVHYLQRRTLILDNIRYLGCTLWSPGDLAGVPQMNDFEYIPDLSRISPLDVHGRLDAFRALHRGDREWLLARLAEEPENHQEGSAEPTTAATAKSGFAEGIVAEETQESKESNELRETEQKEKLGWSSTVVITHYLPSKALVAPCYRNSSLNPFFVADIPNKVIGRADLWFCGHSHAPSKAVIGKCRCWLNPVGYPDQPTRYDKDLTVVL